MTAGLFIPFTQYLLPDGRPRETGIVRSKHIWEKARQINNAGNRFEAEILTTGEVSLTIVGQGEDGDECDLDIEVVENGSGVLAAVDRLIERFFERMKS